MLLGLRCPWAGKAMMKPSSKKCLSTMVQQEALENWLGAELVCDKTTCYLGTKRIYWHTVKELLLLMAIRSVGSEGGVQRYTINSLGRSLLRRPEIEKEIKAAIMQGGSWTVEENRVVRI